MINSPFFPNGFLRLGPHSVTRPKVLVTRQKVSTIVTFDWNNFEELLEISQETLYL